MEDEKLAVDDDVKALLETVEEPAQPAETPAPEPVKTWQLKRGGEVFEKPEEEVLTLAQKGLDYEINNRLLRMEREQFDTQRKQYEGLDAERIKELKALDDYARENPDWLQLVKDSFEKARSDTDQGADPLVKRLSAIESTINEFKSKEMKLAEERADAELDQAIKDLRGKTQEIDWNAKDENGFTVENRVLKHFLDGKFPTVKSAFLDLYGDDWASKRAESAVNKKLKEIQSNHEKGFVLNKRFLTRQSIAPEKSIREKSYDDLLKDSLRELKLGG